MISSRLILGVMLDLVRAKAIRLTTDGTVALTLIGAELREALGEGYDRDRGEALRDVLEASSRANDTREGHA